MRKKQKKTIENIDFRLSVRNRRLKFMRLFKSVIAEFSVRYFQPCN